MPMSNEHWIRKSTILRKCEDLMELLWNEGFQFQISWDTLRTYVESTCGGFRTTINDYMGKRHRNPHLCRSGYLEKFGFAEREPNSWIFLLHHERVQRSYFNEPTNFSLSHLTTPTHTPGQNVDVDVTQQHTITEPSSILLSSCGECREREIKEPFNPNLSFAKPLRREEPNFLAYCSLHQYTNHLYYTKRIVYHTKPRI